MKILNLETSPRGETPCDEAREWFAKTFPAGATVRQAIAACPRGDWLIFGIWNWKLATIEQVVMAACAAGRRSLRYARPEDHAVCLAAFDAADAVADDNSAKNRAAAGAAARAVGTTWAARSAARAAAAAEVSAGVAWAAAATEVSARNAAGVAGNAAWAAGNAAWAAGNAEHLACADAIREVMQTKRWRKVGGKT